MFLKSLMVVLVSVIMGTAYASCIDENRPRTPCAPSAVFYLDLSHEEPHVASGDQRSLYQEVRMKDLKRQALCWRVTNVMTDPYTFFAEHNGIMGAFCVDPGVSLYVWVEFSAIKGRNWDQPLPAPWGFKSETLTEALFAESQFDPF